MSRPQVRPVEAGDLERLLEIEALCFECDRLSRRAFQRWIKGKTGIFEVLEIDRVVYGYGLVSLRRGTRLARLYSLALHPQMRGRGHASCLMLALESAAGEAGRCFMRLEVAKQNRAAIVLYERLGYAVFDEWPDYYEDHSDALRMQKQLKLIAQLP